ncbi:Hydrolase [Rubrivivax sp. A210]|uniref:esterase n=1 Tax=Rubrivivax sp. A210 TaxID=2772301 RepID=UPI0019182680|nr:esterase [Rubrivivax sp. A210]CAD5373605.1 Hydrolase [Rubrivivax sp. A210]
MQAPLEWLPAAGAPEQLILLLHGWGEDGRAMAPLAQALRAQFPQAAVLAPDAPEPCSGDGGGIQTEGRQWYATDDLTPALWAERVAAALPALEAWIKAGQQRLGVGPAATALGGFSQGAVLALALAVGHDGLAGRVLAFGGCFVSPPAAAPRLTTVHLFHGADDAVIPADGSRQALQWLADLNGDATLDIARGVGHALHPALVECCLHRLTHHIPQRTWQAALGAVPARQEGADPSAPDD